MIKIEPYYNRKTDGSRLYNEYLSIVADVVPFYREDVLPAPEVGELDKPRKRTDYYRKTLNRFHVKDESDLIGQKRADAILAKRLIEKYSRPLYEYLYEGCSDDGHVNRFNLNSLLTVKLQNGQVPSEPQFIITGKSQLLLENVFRYDAFSRHPNIYSYVQSIGVEVCPYCNRQFTTTFISGDNKGRPQLDHFRARSVYPYLAISINNLVPCCSVCNLLKRDDDSDKIYPYGEGMDNDCCFETVMTSDKIVAVLTGARISPSEFEIILKNKLDPDSSRGKRIENSVKTFALNELYKAHKGYVSDLYFQRYILTDDIIHDLFIQFPSAFKSEEEIRSALLLMSIERKSWGDRPLAKLTHDIEVEIDSIYTAYKKVKKV